MVRFLLEAYKMTQLRKREKKIEVYASYTDEESYDTVLDTITDMIQIMDTAELEGIIAEAWGTDS